MDQQSLSQKLPFAQDLTSFSIFSEQRADLKDSALDSLISWNLVYKARLQIVSILR